MSYANESEVLEGVILKLSKKRRKLQDDIKEHKLKINSYMGTMGLLELIEELERKIALTRWKLEECELELEVLEKKKNGNANIDPFLN